MATGTLTETVAEELEQAATVTRALDSKVIGSGLIGLGIGAGIGFYVSVIIIAKRSFELRFLRKLSKKFPQFVNIISKKSWLQKLRIKNLLKNLCKKKDILQKSRNRRGIFSFRGAN
jgi:hypothetical protein